MSSNLYDKDVRELVDRLIPLAKKRVVLSLDLSPEDVEFELATLADLFVIQDHLSE